MNLELERLDERTVPANLIPGWTGDEQVIQGRFEAGPLLDTAAVAESGGSCRVVVESPGGAVLLDTIVFDESFRGGGHLAAVGEVGGKDSLLVVPGPGGGPVVAQFDFDSAAGQMVETASFFAPYSQEFRGGLQVSSGEIPVNGVLTPVALFLPGDGGGPQEVGVDLRTHEAEFSIYVGDPADTDQAAFEPTGGTVDIGGGQVGLVVQYGAVVDYHVPTKIWSLDGTDITSERLFED